MTYLKLDHAMKGTDLHRSANSGPHLVHKNAVPCDPQLSSRTRSDRQHERSRLLAWTYRWNSSKKST